MNSNDKTLIMISFLVLPWKWIAKGQCLSFERRLDSELDG